MTTSAAWRRTSRPRRGPLPPWSRRRSPHAPTLDSRLPTEGGAGIYDICDTSSCQVYRGESSEAASHQTPPVTATQGQIVTYAGAPIFCAVRVLQRRLDLRWRQSPTWSPRLIRTTNANTDPWYSWTRSVSVASRGQLLRAEQHLRVAHHRPQWPRRLGRRGHERTDRRRARAGVATDHHGHGHQPAFRRWVCPWSGFTITN